MTRVETTNLAENKILVAFFKEKKTSPHSFSISVSLWQIMMEMNCKWNFTFWSHKSCQSYIRIKFFSCMLEHTHAAWYAMSTLYSVKWVSGARFEGQIYWWRDHKHCEFIYTQSWDWSIIATHRARGGINITRERPLFERGARVLSCLFLLPQSSSAYPESMQQTLIAKWQRCLHRVVIIKS